MTASLHSQLRGLNVFTRLSVSYDHLFPPMCSSSSTIAFKSFHPEDSGTVVWNILKKDRKKENLEPPPGIYLLNLIQKSVCFEEVLLLNVVIIQHWMSHWNKRSNSQPSKKENHFVSRFTFLFFWGGFLFSLLGVCNRVPGSFSKKQQFVPVVFCDCAFTLKA